MKIDIPEREPIELENIVFDYNGTIAVDGRPIKGVIENINELSGQFRFYVITADTYGSVEKELESATCEVIKIPESNQDISKLNFVKKIGSNSTLAIGNGRNDKLMLQEVVLGIGLLQDEGICTGALLASDIVLKSIMDVFDCLKNTNRLVATLRN